MSELGCIGEKGLMGKILNDRTILIKSIPDHPINPKITVQAIMVQTTMDLLFRLQ